MDTSFDYTLSIDYTVCTPKELNSILQILYSGSSECVIDIVEMSEESIARLSIIGYDITNSEHRLLKAFIRNLFNVLKALKRDVEVATIHTLWNTYAVAAPLSPTISSPGTPTCVSPPQIMKKAKSKIGKRTTS